MRRYQQNPWFSPPALQYVARFTGNPPSDRCKSCGSPLSDQDMRHGHQTCGRCAHGHVPEGSRYRPNPPGYGSSMLEYDNYETPPGYGVMHNPGFRAGERVTWSEEALEMDFGRPGDADRPSIEFESGRSRMVNNWEIERAPKTNPWFSPPALQYVARFTGNPPGYGSSMLEYDNYESPPGYGVMHNPAHDVLCQCGWGRLGMEESEIPDRCPVCSHPVGLCTGCGERKEHCDCGAGARHSDDADADYDADTGRHPMLDYYRQQGMQDALDPNYDSYPNPGAKRKKRKKVRVYKTSCRECDGRPLTTGGHSHMAGCPNWLEGVSEESFTAWDRYDPYSKNWPWGERGSPVVVGVTGRGWIQPANPPVLPSPVRGSDTITVRGREVPFRHSAKGKYHHVRVAEPGEFKAIRTKTLSKNKGIKALVGIFKGKGLRGGKTEIQSYLFDAKVYTPQDVVRWIEGHKTPAPLLMEISSASASKRRMKVYGEEAEAPRKKRKQAKAKVKRKPRKIPADSKRCTAKGKEGRCKGYRQSGKTQCALHAAGVAGKRQPKKRKRKVG